MATTLIVLAHPEAASFNAGWARATEAACLAAGDTVLWSDLCAMGFDPVEGPGRYPDPPQPFDALKAQRSTPLPEDVLGEIAKIRAADRLVFHFPLWWFGPPAILKGWCDRALAHGALHDSANRFDTGYFRGRSALFCVTTGSKETESGPGGKEADLRLLLWPLAYTLRYMGYDVKLPVAVHGVHGYHRAAGAEAMAERMQAALEGQAELIAGFDALPGYVFNADSDFDAEGRLKPDSPSHTPFIRL